MRHVYRCYAEKRPGFDVEAGKVLKELKEQLGIEALEGLRIICRYDVDQVEKLYMRWRNPPFFPSPWWMIFMRRSCRRSKALIRC